MCLNIYVAFAQRTVFSRKHVVKQRSLLCFSIYLDITMCIKIIYNVTCRKVYTHEKAEIAAEGINTGTYMLVKSDCKSKKCVCQLV